MGFNLKEKNTYSARKQVDRIKFALCSFPGHLSRLLRNKKRTKLQKTPSATSQQTQNHSSTHFTPSNPALIEKKRKKKSLSFWLCTNQNHCCMNPISLPSPPPPLLLGLLHAWCFTGRGEEELSSHKKVKEPLPGASGRHHNQMTWNTF